MTRKGGKWDLTAIHPETAHRIRSYLDASDHGEDLDGPLVRPLHPNGRAQSVRRHLDSQRIDWILHKYVTQLGLGRGYSSHSMRATFITTALENGAKPEDVPRTVGHADPATT